MDNNEQDQPDMDLEETLSEQSIHSDSPDTSDTFGESELLPRVGDEFQAAIPDLLTPSKRLKYFSNPCDSQPMSDTSSNFLLGQPVPIILACSECTNIKSEGIEVHDHAECSKVESSQCVTECSSDSDKNKSSINGDCVNQKHVANDYGFVPGLPEDSWSEFEVECFLLGLYLLGKNLLQVKRFMEEKKMGKVLSFYYGKFYRSAKYQRWAHCRKTKGRKCIIGQRIITGNRQHELLSRLLPHLSEVSRNALVEAYKAFMDGRTTLEEYIFTLKNTVGIRALVEAVRIGKENEDLTVMAMESSRTNHNSSRPEIPSVKACSDLTYEEILKYLTGEIRLSKARSSDLFWEAIWPRLLAKGWHSEKPNDEAYRGYKNPLVFLLPGIKKYKRKLLKGNHYFDSVSDVLKKVTSEPELLVLDTEENGATPSIKENGPGSDPNTDEDGGSDLEHHCYLKPRSYSNAANHMKFTVVDTSMLLEGASSKVKELKSLPADMNDSLTIVRGPREAEAYLKRPSVKHNADHPLKRRRLTACSKVDKKRAVRKNLPESTVQPNFVLSLPAVSKKTARKRHSQARISQRVSPTSSSVADNHVEKIYKEDPCSLATTSGNLHQSQESQPLIDLNVPQILPAEPEVNGQVINVKIEEVSEQIDRPATNGACQDEQVNENTRRLGTRIRPLSTRALEALESSFCNPKTGKKRPQAIGDPQDEKPKVSRRARTKSSLPSGNCTVDAVKNSDELRSDQIHNAADLNASVNMTL